MSRIWFRRDRQRKFLEDVINHTNLKPGKLAEICSICNRTFRDWKREKHRISHSALFKLCEVSQIAVPNDIKILPEFWSIKKASRIGGKRYVELYGSPGNLESRRRGGTISQRRFSKNPKYARRVGFIVRKEIRHPKKSSLLAEFIGIMIGDGGIRNNHQISISFNLEKDQDYAKNIQKMVKKLFNISSTKYIRKQYGAADIIVTSRTLIEFLERLGIKKGNKVKNQIDIPGWIFESKKYQSACLRGIFDTDGCIYKHNYTVNGKKYMYIKMCFRNSSLPVLGSLKKILKHLRFHPVIDKRHQAVYLNIPREVKDYFLRIGTSNPRYYSRYNKFFSEKIGRIGEVA